MAWITLTLWGICVVALILVYYYESLLSIEMFDDYEHPKN